MNPVDSKVISESELRELFRRHRPDAESFRKGVRARVSARVEAGRGANIAPMPTLARRAAAWLPLEPHSTLGLGAVSKALVISMTLPVLLLVTSILAFVFGRRALLAAQQQAAVGTQAASGGAAQWIESRQPEVRWFRYLHITMLLIAAALALLSGAQWANDVAIVLFTMCALGLMLGVRGLAHANLFTPGRVAEIAFLLLTILFQYLFVWPGIMGKPRFETDLGVGLAALVVFIGLLVCWWRAFSAGFELVLKPKGAFPLLAMTLVFGILNPFGLLFLDSTPAPVTPVSTLSAEQQLYGQRQLLELTGRIYFNIPFVEEEMRKLSSRTDLTIEQRAHLLERLDASWPDASSFAALSQALRCLEGYQRLNAGDRIESHRQQTHELLAASWVGATPLFSFYKAGGFSKQPEQFPTSSPEATLDAVHLMEFHGVPSAIDIRRVRGYLRASGSASTIFDIRPQHKAVQREALRRIEAAGLVPAHATLLDSILAERLLIVSILSVLLCVLAIRSAQQSREWIRPGALP